MSDNSDIKSVASNNKLTGKFCPTCEKPALEQHKPFCSKRCADVDLGKWFQEAYTISRPVDFDLED